MNANFAEFSAHHLVKKLEQGSATEQGGKKGLSCLLLPLPQKTLVVPNVQVAEILLNANVQWNSQQKDLFPWLEGWLDWRGIFVPLLAWEALAEDMSIHSDEILKKSAIAANLEAPTGDVSSKFAVLHAMTQGSFHAFYAFRLIASPRLLTVNMAQITEDKTSRSDVLETLPGQAMAVDIDGLDAFIPDLQYIEDRLQIQF